MSTLHVVQVSDTHLSRDGTYFQGNWDAFIDCMREDPPDFVFVTGDLCLNGPKNPQDLEYAREQMDRLPVPWRAIPGNHDVGDVPPDVRLGAPLTNARRALYRRQFGADFWAEDLGDWRFIGLNAQLMDSGLPAEKTQMTLLCDALEGAGRRRIALLVHKPLFLSSAVETQSSLGAVLPRSRKRLLELCAQYRVKLVASGHRHCYRSLRCGSTQLIWAPATAFIDSLEMAPGIRLTRRVGFIRYQFHANRFEHEFVEPATFINHDMRNWLAAHGSTTRLPLRASPSRHNE